MRFGIPLLDDRVAPRCTFADSVLVVTTKWRRIQAQAVVPLAGNTWADLAEILDKQRVDTLVCGGISQSTRESLDARDVAIIDNVAGTSQEVLEALRNERIHPGFGLTPGRSSDEREARRHVTAAAAAAVVTDGTALDCLQCRDRGCLRGEPCPYVPPSAVGEVPEERRALLEAAWDVALERERTLCRLAEVVYLALEMGYRKVGVAFCVELEEPAAILTGVLRRFFDVIPVCCRVGGGIPAGGAANAEHDAGEGSMCDPTGMARVLNAAETELNVLVGLCVGVDCIFNRVGKAPVTTLFVKDRSLANNPIGAVYSHYYLKDI